MMILHATKAMHRPDQIVGRADVDVFTSSEEFAVDVKAGLDSGPEDVGQNNFWG